MSDTTEIGLNQTTLASDLVFVLPPPGKEQVFTMVKPEGLSPEELGAIAQLEAIGCQFLWPTDISRTPQAFDVTNIPIEHRA